MILLACAAVLACSAEDPAMARVGERDVELASFQDYVGKASGEPWQVANARVASRLLDQYLDRMVLLEAARAQGVLSSAEVPAVSPSELRWLMDEVCGAVPELDPERISDLVAQRMQRVEPAKAHVRQILVDTLDEAVAARSRLEAGEDFVAISREVSRAPNAAAGGELGFIEQNSLPPDIDTVVFSLEPDAISRPVQGTSGYHVFQVLEVVAPGPPNRVEVEAEVRTELAQMVAREHTRACLRRLAEEVGVDVNRNLLWFPYEGRYVEVVKDA